MIILMGTGLHIGFEGYGLHMRWKGRQDKKENTLSRKDCMIYGWALDNLKCHGRACLYENTREY